MICESLVIGRSGSLYTSSRADHIKQLNVFRELDSIYPGVVISGPLADNTCSNTNGPPFCYGDSDGVGTFVCFNRITAIALKVDSNDYDQMLFVAEKTNNKIKSIDLNSSQFVTTTFVTQVDTWNLANGFLQG